MIIDLPAHQSSDQPFTYRSFTHQPIRPPPLPPALNIQRPSRLKTCSTDFPPQRPKSCIATGAAAAARAHATIQLVPVLAIEGLVPMMTHPIRWSIFPPDTDATSVATDLGTSLPTAGGTKGGRQMPPTPDKEPPDEPLVLLGMVLATVLHKTVWTEAGRGAELQPEHSTVDPDHIISKTGRRPRRQRDADIRGRSTAPVSRRGQPVIKRYSPALPSISSYQYSRSTRSSRTFESGPTYSYIPSSRRGPSSELSLNISSSTVTHPFAYDDSGMTHTWHPPPWFQFSEASHRSRRSDAPFPDSRASYR